MYVFLNRDVAQEKRRYEYKLCRKWDNCNVEKGAKAHLKDPNSVYCLKENGGCVAYYRNTGWIHSEKDNDNDNNDDDDKDESNLNHFRKPCRLDSSNCLTMSSVKSLEIKNNF